MSKGKLNPRRIRFHTEQDAIAEVERVRDGACETCGRWTLEQTAWHTAMPLKMCLHKPARLEPTEDERKMQAYLDDLEAEGQMADGLDAPAGTEPPPRCDASEIDALIDGLRNLADYRESHVDFGPFGPTPTPKFRAFVLIHTAHHLGMFRPAE